MGMKRILAVHTVRVPFLSYVIETTFLHDQIARTHFKAVQLCTSLCLRVKHVTAVAVATGTITSLMVLMLM